MEGYNSPSFDGSGDYDGFDFAQAELEFTNSEFSESALGNTFPESWAIGESNSLFPDIFPEDWITGELPEKDQPGELVFPDIWQEEVRPTINGEVVFDDNFPEFWLYGPSVSDEAMLEKATQVSHELASVINEIGAKVLRRFVQLNNGAVELYDSLYPNLETQLDYYKDFSENERQALYINELESYNLTAGALAINSNRRLRDRLAKNKETDTDPEIYRSYLELTWNENTDSYVLTWRNSNTGPMLKDLLEAINRELGTNGNWAVSHETNQLLIYPFGGERRDGDILQIVNSAAEEVYKLPGDQIIETDISYNL